MSDTITLLNNLRKHFLDLKAISTVQCIDIALLQTSELERRVENLKEQVRVGDVAFNFHLKRGNDLMEKCNQLQASLDASLKRLGENDEEIKSLRDRLKNLTILI